MPRPTPPANPQAAAIRHLRRHDPVLRAIIDRLPPANIVPIPPKARFAALVNAIISQQLSTAAARTIRARLLLACNNSLTPATLAPLTAEQLRVCGISPQKRAYLHDLALATTDGRLTLNRLTRQTDDEIIIHLTHIKGIGLWTAHMFLIFALARPDILPTGDLGIQNAIQRLYNLPARPTPAQIETIAKPWRPHASTAAWYLWRSLELKT